MSVRLLTSLLVSATLLIGCSTSPSQPETDPAGASTFSGRDTPTQGEPPVVEMGTTIRPPPPPERKFPIDSFFSLLVAEMAGHRQQYALALTNYIKEAERTRDPGVAGYAARLAAYLDDHPSALRMSLLWLELQPYSTEAMVIAVGELIYNQQLLEALDIAEVLYKRTGEAPFQSIANQAANITDTQREVLLQRLQVLQANYPESVELLISISAVRQQQGELDAALALARQALKAEPNNVGAAIHEARVLYQMERPDQAIARLLDMLKQNPDNQRLRLQYARLLASNDLAKAQEQFEILARRSPENPDILFSLGLVARENNELALAKRSFIRLLELNQREDTANFYLGQIAEAENDTVSALRYYLAVRQGNELFSALNQGLGILAKESRVGEIALLMDQWRRERPEQANQFYLLQANALSENNYLDDAVDVLSQALSRDLNNPDFLFSRALINQKRARLADTEADLRRVIKYQPNNAAALNALGYTLADETTRYDEALQLITQALAISPEDPAIIDSMGWVQYRLGNYDEALLRLRQAMKAYPDPEIASHLGEVLWVTGAREEALQVWRQGYELDPEHPLIPAAMQRLDASFKDAP